MREPPDESSPDRSARREGIALARVSHAQGFLRVDAAVTGEDAGGKAWLEEREEKLGKCRCKHKAELE